ncbi:SDR family NAD(P)-dependent oxidoreductase [Pontitalea aquivivens]|uniref:SDR family NAD(P)-dependent oxidoreductase n=1 Tax=Pontitalea aquivivens TaxID=3388663 RepID=UPI0039705AEC
MIRLDGKAIAITGAGGGLGAAYARHVAALGASVLVNDITPAAAARTVAEITAAGGRAAALPGDVAAWGFGETLVSACVDAFGAIDGLVNNAGILRPALLEDVTEADFRHMVEVNLLGTAACAQAAGRRMRAAGRGGAILNVTSGSQAGDIALGGYGATKGAIAALTYSWAMELRGSGIRMNALSPLAETAMAAQNAHLMALQGQNREVHYTTLPPAKANAPVVAYLLSDAAREVHGQVIRIAGRQLSFVTHPMIAAPVIEGDWTCDSVAGAFASTLLHHQHKLGLAFTAATP